MQEPKLIVLRDGPEAIAVTADEYQRRRLKLPKGDIRLEDGRVLRRIIGYDLSKVKTNEATHNGFLASAGWRHAPTGFIVSAGIEDTHRWGALLHVSMSYPDHDPNWAEIKVVRYAFFPRDCDVAMMLPRDGDYVNLSPHCFHLWQCPQEWGLM